MFFGQNGQGIRKRDVVITLNASRITWNANGGTLLVSVSVSGVTGVRASNLDYTLSESGSGWVVTPGSDSVTVTAPANTTAEAVPVTLTVSYRGVSTSIDLVLLSAQFSSTPTISAVNTASTVTCGVRGNVNDSVTFESDVDWITEITKGAPLSGASTTFAYKYSMQVAENPDYTNRTGHVTFTAFGNIKSITTISQLGEPIEGITVTPSSLSYDNKGVVEDDGSDVVSVLAAGAWTVQEKND